MQVTVQIHEAWLARPEDLRRVMALLAGLEDPPSGRMRDEGGRLNQTSPAGPTHPSSFSPQPSDEEEPFDPEGRAPGRRGPDRGDAWEPEDRGQQDSPPADGRQLLGWAGKQVPDMKGPIIGWGKKKGLHAKIVEWTPQQVAAAYRFARGRLGSTTR
jgi:hypothetical protein